MRDERGLGTRPPCPARNCTRGVADEQGQSLIELAVTLPVFFLLVFGFINFALIMFGVCNATFAARAAVRNACIHSTASFVPATQTTLNALVQPLIFQYPQNTYTVTLLPSSGGNAVGATATVTLSITYNIAFPGFSYNALQVNTTASGVVVQ